MVPYLLTMSYFSSWGRESILKEEQKRYYLEADEATELVEFHLQRFEREMDFLSQLEIFDDMVSNDINRSISRMLEKMSKLEEGSKIELHAINYQGKIIASSNSEMLEKNYTIIEPSTTIFHRSVVIRKPLKVSFDNRTLGYLIADYPIKNLTRLLENKGESGYSIASKESVIYGDSLASKPYSVGFEGILDEYRIYYSIDESRSSNFIDDFLFYLLIIVILGMLLIYYISCKLTEQITHPIIALTQSAEEIISTQNYTLRVPRDTIDEIGSHALMFNRLVKTAGEALKKLSLENQFRMQRFIDLTDTFNHISQIDNEERCIDVSIEKLRSVVSYPIYFHTIEDKSSNKHLSIELYLHDILSRKKILYGYLIIEKKQFEDSLEERFFQSVGAMMMLQVERISLTKKIQGASEAKSTFISSMSHELRTPLNAIIGFSQYLIMYETMSDEQIDTIAKVEKSALHLLTLINDILDISKIEAGKMSVKLKDEPLAKLLNESVELISPLAQEKGLTLKIDISEVEKFVLRTDSKLFKQVIINLLSNAVKFTNNGSINLLALLEKKQLTIRITDTGIGIKKENLNKVFEAFTQLKEPQAIMHKGTGLGLSLSRHMAHAIGARLTLRSEGKGLGTVTELLFNP